MSFTILFCNPFFFLHGQVSDEHEEDAIRPLPWYPGNLAWHLNFSRMQLRRNQALEGYA